jgi:hypothetical protein
VEAQAIRRKVQNGYRLAASAMEGPRVDDTFLSDPLVTRFMRMPVQDVLCSRRTDRLSEFRLVAVENGERLTVERETDRNLLRLLDSDGVQERQESVCQNVGVPPYEGARSPHHFLEDLDPANVAAMDDVPDADRVEQRHRLSYKQVPAMAV